MACMPLSGENPGATATLLLDIYQRLATVEQQNKQLLEQAGHAASDRKEILEMLIEVERIRERLDQVTPIVSELERLRLQGIGASYLGGYLAKGMWALIGAGIAAVTHWWSARP